MKATYISREKNDVKFTMEFTAEEFDNAQIKAYQAAKGNIEIPGFRRGKAPRSIIEKHYGEGIFFEDAIDELFREHYPNALRELELDIIDSPSAEFSELKKGEGFTATITVACSPIVEVKDYKGVEIEKIENEVKDEDVDNDIKSLQKRNARIISVERPAQDGDTVLLDYAGFVGEDQFEGGTAEGQELVLGSGMFIPGFEEQLVGVSAGEKKDVTVTFPEEYHAEDLAGKEAVFHCTVHEVKEEQLPELDDEFAKDVSEFDTLEELKASTRERLESYAKAGAESQMKDAALGKVVESNEVDIPAIMVNDEIDRMLQELDQQMRYQGLSLEQYIQYTGKDAAALRDELRPEAEKAVKTRLILNGIVEAEQFEVTPEEVDEELKTMAAQYQMTPEKVKELIGDNIKYMEKDLKTRKAVDFIFDNAVIK
ncbi:MAG: trigger factor [Firmicutes bacterium]|nr:trigger factor [Bacillota bacterium]MDD7601616.1 trigger factor [Bacillota bacterium]MDY5857384.1 trigger factor [Anaerovoracaceae bacterium]